eukprot:31555-Pelagococcus_subviridis.AAC.10
MPRGETRRGAFVAPRITSASAAAGDDSAHGLFAMTTPPVARAFGSERIGFPAERASWHSLRSSPGRTRVRARARPRLARLRASRAASRARCSLATCARVPRARSPCPRRARLCRAPRSPARQSGRARKSRLTSEKNCVRFEFFPPRRRENDRRRSVSSRARNAKPKSS